VAALLASALAGLLVAASLGGRYTLAAGVALAQALLALGLARSTDIPAARTSAGVALVAGLAASGLVLLEREQAFDSQALTPVLATAGAGFVAMIVVQLARRDGRDRLTASLTLGVTMLLLTTALAAWLTLGDGTVGTALLLLALTGAAVGAAIMIFPGPAPLWLVGATISAASIGLVLQAYVPEVDDADLGLLAASVVAGSCGLAAALGVWIARLVRDDHPLGRHAHVAIHVDASPITHALTISALPLALAAPAAVAAAWAVAEGVLS
jgi:hypothetical protein